VVHLFIKKYYAKWLTHTASFVIVHVLKQNNKEKKIMEDKYFIIQSRKNSRGIWVHESDLTETKEHYFAGHKNVTVTEISEEEYYSRINGCCSY